MTNVERVLLCATLSYMDVVQLTKNLMSIPSVSGNELSVLKYLSSVLLERGFLLRHINVGDGTYCIAATKGVSDTWIVGHTDTVPGVVKIEVKEGKLYGRGACDTKGNISAAVIAAENIPNINLLFTVGEEDTFRGARVASQDVKVVEGKRFLILEPTSSEIMDGQLAAVLITVSALGTQKHSAFIEKFSDSAIHNVVTVLGFLGEKSLPFLNIGMIHGGIAKNIVAPECTAEVVVRPSTLEEYNKTIKIVEDVQKMFSEVTLEIQVALEPLEGKRQVRGFTEAYFFRGEGRGIAIVGAGDLHVAHSPQEHVPLNELEALPNKIKAWVESE